MHLALLALLLVATACGQERAIPTPDIYINYSVDPGDSISAPTFELTLYGGNLARLRCRRACAASGEIVERFDEQTFRDIVKALRAGSFFRLPRRGTLPADSHGAGQRLTYRDGTRIHEVALADTRVPDIVKMVRGVIDLKFWLTPSVELYRRRMEQGWRPTHLDDYHGSALGAAISACDAASVRFLVDNGAPIEPGLVSLCPGLDVANALLPARPASLPPAWGGVLLDAASRGHDSLTRLLVERGVPLDVRDGDGQTPLMRAVKSGHYATINLLLAHGASANAIDPTGRSVMAIATASYNTAGIELLSRYGANVDAQDASGRTALILAAAQCHTWNVDALLKVGADPTIRDKTGTAAVDAAPPDNGGDSDKCAGTRARLTAALLSRRGPH